MRFLNKNRPCLHPSLTQSIHHSPLTQLSVTHSVSQTSSVHIPANPLPSLFEDVFTLAKEHLNNASHLRVWLSIRKINKREYLANTCGHSLLHCDVTQGHLEAADLRQGRGYKCWRSSGFAMTIGLRRKGDKTIRPRVSFCW